VFVPLSENLETHYREGNLIPQVDYAFGKAHLERRLMDEDRARDMKIFLLRGGYLGGKSLGDDGEEYTEYNRVRRMAPQDSAQGWLPAVAPAAGRPSLAG